MKRLIAVMMAGMLATGLVFASMMGTRITLTTTPETQTFDFRVTKISVYNAGTNDVGLMINSSAAAIIAGMTANTVALIPGGQTLTIDYTVQDRSLRTDNVITNVVLRAEAGSSLVYAVAY